MTTPATPFWDMDADDGSDPDAPIPYNLAPRDGAIALFLIPANAAEDSPPVLGSIDADGGLL